MIATIELLEQMYDRLNYEIYEYVYYFIVANRKAVSVEIQNRFKAKYGRDVITQHDLSKMKPLEGTSPIKWWFVNKF